MPARVRFTANFESNLDSIRTFLADIGAEHSFEDLIDHLFNTWIPNLQSFPGIGRDFRRIPPASIEGDAGHRRLLRLAGTDTEIREYIAGDYLLLYGVRRSTIFLLSIRHHRQLSFDLRDHWQ